MGPERRLGVNTPGAAFDQGQVGVGGSILQLPFLPEEVSDICAAVFQRVPKGTGPSYLSGDSLVDSLYFSF